MCELLFEIMPAKSNPTPLGFAECGWLHQALRPSLLLEGRCRSRMGVQRGRGGVDIETARKGDRCNETFWVLPVKDSLQTATPLHDRHRESDVGALSGHEAGKEKGAGAGPRAPGVARGAGGG